MKWNQFWQRRASNKQDITSPKHCKHVTVFKMELNVFFTFTVLSSSVRFLQREENWHGWILLEISEPKKITTLRKVQILFDELLFSSRNHNFVIFVEEFPNIWQLGKLTFRFTFLWNSLKLTIDTVVRLKAKRSSFRNSYDSLIWNLRNFF